MKGRQEVPMVYRNIALRAFWNIGTGDNHRNSKSILKKIPLLPTQLIVRDRNIAAIIGGKNNISIFDHSRLFERV